jgi:hypothetical protein
MKRNKRREHYISWLSIILFLKWNFTLSLQNPHLNKVSICWQFMRMLLESYIVWLIFLCESLSYYPYILCDSKALTMIWGIAFVPSRVWKHVQKGDTVIDATCGNGFDTLALLNLIHIMVMCMYWIFIKML